MILRYINSNPDQTLSLDNPNMQDIHPSQTFTGNKLDREAFAFTGVSWVAVDDSADVRKQRVSVDSVSDLVSPIQ